MIVQAPHFVRADDLSTAVHRASTSFAFRSADAMDARSVAVT